MIGSLGTRYKVAGADEGFLTGLPGAWGIPRDIVALVCLNLRACGKYGTYCGFDLGSQAERLYVLHVLSLASSPSDAPKALAMAQLTRIARDVAKKKAWKELEAARLREADTAGLPRSRCAAHEDQARTAVPFAGAVLGAGFNAYFRSQIVRTAHFLYRERFLAEKCSLAGRAAEVLGAALDNPDSRAAVSAAVHVLKAAGACTVLPSQVGPIVAEDIENRWASDERFRMLTKNMFQRAAQRLLHALPGQRLLPLPGSQGPRIQRHPGQGRRGVGSLRCERRAPSSTRPRLGDRRLRPSGDRLAIATHVRSELVCDALRMALADRCFQGSGVVFRPVQCSVTKTVCQSGQSNTQVSFPCQSESHPNRVSSVGRQGVTTSKRRRRQDRGNESAAWPVSREGLPARLSVAGTRTRAVQR